MHVAEPGMCPDDLQAGIPGDVLLLQLDGPAAHVLRAVVLPLPRKLKAELEVRVPRVGVQFDRALELRDGRAKISLTHPQHAGEPLMRLAVVRLEPDRFA